MNATTLSKAPEISKLFNNKPVEKTTKIMIVEDDDGIRELVYFALRKQGYKVVAYDSALKALDNIQSDKVDIIISDLMMPKMDGIEFCSVVKKKYKHIFFIILTAKDSIDDKVEGLEVGADEYITKPFDFMELLARVKAAERIINTQKQLIFVNEQLEKLADTDELTKLKNRRYFQSEAPKEIQRADRYGHTVAVLMLDIDDFKQINDTYGHLVGDEALKMVSSVLLGSTRASDIVCRYGGEEFVIFLPEINPKNAFKVAEKIRKNMEAAKLSTEEGKISMTISIGIAIKTPHMHINLKELIDQADKALYSAKKDGKNKTVIYKWFKINDLKRVQ
jgi:diguanylate cyclase (GGDEF)-like protein